MGKTYPKVIELLKGEFEVKKTTKYSFCKKTGINPTSVERYLCGISEPNQATLQKLADYFEVPVAYLREEVEGFKIQFSSDEIDEIKKVMTQLGMEFTVKNVSDFVSMAIIEAFERMGDDPDYENDFIARARQLDAMISGGGRNNLKNLKGKRGKKSP